MSLNPRWRRHRVVLRPKERGRRLRLLLAAAAMGLVGSAAALTIRHLSPRLSFPMIWPSSLSTAAWRTEISGAPESLRPQVQAFLDARRGPAPAGGEQAALRERFGWIAEVRARRQWLSRGVRYDLTVRRAAGRVARQGPQAAWLSDEGVVFTAPETLYPSDLPLLEVGQAPPAELAVLARTVAELSAPAALPSRLAGMKRVSGAEGWQARLSDGTHLQWGSLTRTSEKLERLKSVFSQGRAEFGEGFSADLRYFEDGRILVRPLSSKSLSMR